MRVWMMCVAVLAWAVLALPGSGCRCERRISGAVESERPSASVEKVSGDVEAAPLAVPTLTPRHAHAWGGVGEDAVVAVLVDGRHALIAGTFEGTMALGAHTLESAGERDVFIARVSPGSGEVQWAHRLGGAGDDAVGGWTRISEERTVLVGSFEGVVALGSVEHTSAGKKDVFAAEIAPADGAIGWSRVFGGEGVDVAAGVASDASAVVLTGYFMGHARFGEEQLEAQSADVFLVSLEPETGAVRWARGYGGAGSDKATAVAMAPGGDILVTGAFRQSVNLGGEELACAGSRDGFLARYGADGAHRWSLGFGGEGTDQGNALAVAADGSVALAGTFQGRFELGGEALVSGDQRNPLIAYFDADGRPLWAHGHRADLPSEATALALTEDALWVAGTFQGEIDLGGGRMTSDNVSQDLFLVRESLRGGVHQASLWLGGEGRDDVAVLAVTPEQLLLGGSFEHNTRYAGQSFRSKGESDAWLSAVAR